MDLTTQFQTPPPVCDYMASLAPKTAKYFLEPTPGQGNIKEAIKRRFGPEKKGIYIDAPYNYFTFDFKPKYDCVIMNPPFSEKHGFGLPDGLEIKGMRLGYYMLLECMKKSDNVIALMPWFTIIDSDVRLRTLNEFGIKSITALPRKTFEYSRIQTCVIELLRGRNRQTEFKTFNF